MFNNIFNTNKNEIILYSGEGDAGYNHLRYWIPEFIKAKISFAVLVRNEKLQKLIKTDYRNLNIVCAKSPLDVESLFNKMQNLKTIYYMSNTINNIHLVRFNEYKHIFIGTEYFDRDAQVTKMLRAYDELWLTSQASVDKIKQYFDVNELCIKLIGKPQLKNLSNYSLKIPKTILLTLSSIKFDIKELLNSLKEYQIDIFLDSDFEKNNPFSRDIKKQFKEYILFNDLNCNVIDLLLDENINKYEIVICDTYTYNHKFLAFDTKMYVYIPDEQNINTIFLTKYISFDGLYSFSSGDELMNILNNGDNMKETREKFCEYWIGKEPIFDIKLKEII